MKSEINWIGIRGNTFQEGTELIFRPPPSTGQPAEKTENKPEAQKPSGVIKSNIRFSEGTISWETILKDNNDICNVVLTCDPNNSHRTTIPTESGNGTNDVSLAFFGLNCLRATYGAGLLINGEWRGLGGAGHGTSLPRNQWIKVKIKSRGSKTTLYVNDIEVLEVSQGVKPGPVGFYFEGTEEIKIRNIEVETKKRKCFVVMQFTEKFNTLYEEVIKPTCSNFDYEVIRGDDFHKSEPILIDIINSITEASLIIADITPDNSNVFYELGYAHALKKPTILLSDKSREKLPFDISGFRTLFYENTIGGKTSIENRLRQFLQALEN